MRFRRQHLDGTPGGRQRGLIEVVEGGYATRTFLPGLPEQTDVVAYRMDLVGWTATRF